MGSWILATSKPFSTAPETAFNKREYLDGPSTAPSVGFLKAVGSILIHWAIWKSNDILELWAFNNQLRPRL